MANETKWNRDEWTKTMRRKREVYNVIDKSLPLHTNPFVLIPISPLMFWRAIFDEFALAANLPSSLHGFRDWRGVHTEFRAIGAPCCADGGMRDITERDVAVNPVAHFSRFHPSPLCFRFDLKNWSSLDPPPGKADYFTIVCATRIGTSCRIIIEYRFIGNVWWVGEEDLRVRSGEKDNEPWSFLVEDSAHGEVNLGETGRAVLTKKFVAETHIYYFAISVRVLAWERRGHCKTNVHVVFGSLYLVYTVVQSNICI